MSKTNGKKPEKKNNVAHRNAKPAAGFDFITIIAGVAIAIVLIGSVIIAGRMTDGFKDFSFGFATREPVVYTYTELNAELNEVTVYTTWELGQLKQYLKVTGITVDGKERELRADEYELSGDLSLHNENNYSVIAVKHPESGIVCTVSVPVTVPQVTGIKATITLPNTFRVTTLTNADVLREYINCTVQTSDGKTAGNEHYELKILTESGNFEAGENDVEISCYGYKQVVKVFAEPAGTETHEHKFVNDKCTECGRLYYTNLTARLQAAEDFAVYSETEAEDLKGYIKVTAISYKGEESVIADNDYDISADFNIVGEDGYSTVLITHKSTGLACSLKVRVIDKWILSIEAQVAGKNMPEITTQTDVEIFRKYTTVRAYTSDGSEVIVEDYTLRVLTPSGKFEVGTNEIEVSYCGLTDTFTWEILK